MFADPFVSEECKYQAQINNDFKHVYCQYLPRHVDYGKIIQFDPGNSQYFEDLSDLGAFFALLLI